jgi:hypothetical protein
VIADQAREYFDGAANTNADSHIDRQALAHSIVDDGQEFRLLMVRADFEHEAVGR